MSSRLVQKRTYNSATEMMEEHCHMRGHDAPFDCSLHYESKDGKAPVPVTTAKDEWEYVTNGTAPSWLKTFKAKDGENHERKARVFIEYTEELKKDPNKQKAEILSEPERLGLALYTGPMVCCCCSHLMSSSF
jgi:hypothetical protein